MRNDVRSVTRLEVFILVAVLIFVSTAVLFVFVAWSGALVPLFPAHAVRALQRPAAMYAAESYANEILKFSEDLQQLVLENKLVDAMKTSLALADAATERHLFRPYVAMNVVIHGAYRDMYYTSYTNYAGAHWGARFMTERNRHTGFVWSYRLALYHTQSQLMRVAGVNASYNFVVKHSQLGGVVLDMLPNGFNPLTASVVNMSLLDVPSGGSVAVALAAVTERPRHLVVHLAAQVGAMREKRLDWALWEDELIDAAVSIGITVSFGNAAAMFVRALHLCGITHVLLSVAVVLASICAMYYESYASLRRDIERKATAFCQSVATLDPSDDSLKRAVQAGLGLAHAYARACRACIHAPWRFNSELLVHNGATQRVLDAAMISLRSTLLPRLRLHTVSTRNIAVVFSSFASSEISLAVELQKALQSSDVSVLVRDSSIMSVDAWDHERYGNLVHNRCAVVFLSPSFVMTAGPLWELMLLMARHQEELSMIEKHDANVTPLLLVPSVAWEQRGGVMQASTEPPMSDSAIAAFLRPLVASNGELPLFERNIGDSDVTRSATLLARRVVIVLSQRRAK
jgi:hypothetical protein